MAENSYLSPVGRSLILLAVLATMVAAISTTLAAETLHDEIARTVQSFNLARQGGSGFSNTPGPSGEALPEGIAISGAFGSDYASDDEVQAAVGDVTIGMDKCPTSTIGDDQRSVRVQLSSPNYDSPSVKNTLLLRALKYAWSNCPQPFLTIGSGAPNGTFHYDVSQITFYLPDGTPTFSAALGMNGGGDQALMPGHNYNWQHLTNLIQNVNPPSPSESPSQAETPTAPIPQPTQEAHSAPTILWVIIGAPILLAVLFFAIRAINEDYRQPSPTATSAKTSVYNEEMRLSEEKRRAEQADARQRLDMIIKLAEMDGNPLTLEEIRMYEMFIEKNWSDEQCIKYIRERHSAGGHK